MTNAQKLSTCPWFNTEAETAAQFYVSLFENSRVTGLSRYGNGARMPEGTVLMVTLELAGTEFMAINGGPSSPLPRLHQWSSNATRNPRPTGPGTP
jgi:predicted 3-demethylubiquinone-9 3-methyltransferase (glyoxalase superfamily)